MRRGVYTGRSGTGSEGLWNRGKKGSQMSGRSGSSETRLLENESTEENPEALGRDESVEMGQVR